MCRSMEEMLNEYGEEVTEKNKREFAMRMIDAGKVPLNEIAEYTGLSIDSVNQLAAEVRN